MRKRKFLLSWSLSAFFSAELRAKNMDKHVFIKNASQVANLCKGLEELALMSPEIRAGPRVLLEHPALPFPASGSLWMLVKC